MPMLTPEAWRPRGIADLEPNAWRALQREGSVCVVAGPGAGKTEFLAQRAAYLLETGICRAPHRVLAISFKSDAAKNLAARVHERCAPEQAERFVSLTFDAFTKGLVDRFLAALPEGWRPTKPYEVGFDTRREVEDFLTQARLAARPAWQTIIAEFGPSDFESRIVGSTRLELTPTPPTTGQNFATEQWWQQNLRRRGQSRLTFVMINRLAELLLRMNPQIARAIRATYRHVFIDEFQDTTFAQYDFLLSAFRSPKIAVTAVGDDKQRIMTWAGARTDAFMQFEADFETAKIRLLSNFRSSPELVQIQHVVAQALDAETMLTRARVVSKIDGDVAQVWNCKTEAAEAQQIATWLAADMTRRRTSARDYAILVRQTPDRFEKQLEGPLAAVGLRLRNESRALGRLPLQDLLGEEFATIGVALLRLGATRRAAQAWQTASVAVQRLRAVDPDDELACFQAEESLNNFLVDLRATMADGAPAADSAHTLTEQILTFIDREAFARTYLEYGTGETLEIAIEAFQLHLASCADGAGDWSFCLDRFEGVDEVPLMTVHKSKGLEYDTILFVGLDDKMWWSHSVGNPEGIATFFVALSRAKQRVIFTFCSARGQRRKVADLFQLLTSAGVPEVQF